MSIQAIAIPQKHVKTSALVADADLDLGAFSLLTDDIRAAVTALYIDKPAVMGGVLDSLVKSQYFTIVDGATELRKVTGDTTTTSTSYSDVLAVGWFKVPAGAMSGNLGVAVTLFGSDASCITYARPYNFTKSAYIGVEMSHTGVTPTLKYQAINLAAGTFEAGDIILLHGKVNNALYTGTFRDPYVRGTVTATFKAGTVSWI